MGACLCLWHSGVESACRRDQALALIVVCNGADWWSKLAAAARCEAKAESRCVLFSASGTGGGGGSRWVLVSASGTRSGECLPP